VKPTALSSSCPPIDETLPQILERQREAKPCKGPACFNLYFLGPVFELAILIVLRASLFSIENLRQTDETDFRF